MVDYNYVLPALGILFVLVGITNNIKIPARTLVLANGNFKETKKYSLIEMLINIVGQLVFMYFFGIYGACSTMTEGMCLGSMAIDGEYAKYVLCGASSHYCTAERQFRFPLELGNQKPMTAQWTVTGAGSVLLTQEGEGPKIIYIIPGKVIDKGIDDGNNMGAAMAPAAIDTIYSYFDDTKDDPDSFDLIATGDLGKVGKQIVIELLQEKKLDISKVYTDCGLEIFNLAEQDVHCGGSGCGCSATVFASYIYEKLIKKEFNKVMLVSTGALLSPTSTLQKQTIPSVAHGVVIVNE